MSHQLYYEDSGRGDAVVLMPGWGGSIVDLNGVRRELGSGFRVIAVDLPGSGRSQPQPRDYPPTYYRDDAHLLLGLLDELRVDAAHLVGFSDGGEEALLMAQLQPARALSVLTWGAAGQIVASQKLLDGLTRLVDEPIDELKPLAAYLAEKHGVAGARTMASSWSRAMAAVVDAGGDVSRSGAAAIRCPALLMTGTYDPFCPPELVEEMAGAIPRGRFLEIMGAGHDAHLSHAGFLSRTVVSWLADH
ncbi:alpha/beta fold hydrolase [Asanoa iriomotensis]|uniref:Hydrolase n=1 Tax=Asanoa iriomotensis TaxID=234613 RepID=A0ABQ4BUA6_9ACTN|nr:alpha/beta hydrolase [Asanoa iriomotensis]GIF54105.1 hydrolase [Asanoa iriomotensis]